ncbi:MAG: hypothetical protein ACI4BB_05065 [Coprococcus sp.]
MNTYGFLLKKLIRFTNIKLTNLAEIVGYDTSYISKWCNKDKLPAAKASSSVNKCLADVFAEEVFAQGEEALFARDFKIEEPKDKEQLAAFIFHILKEAYKESYDNTPDNTRTVTSTQYRLLLWEPDIKAFFKTELPHLVRHIGGSCHILCTMDICSFLPDLLLEHPCTDIPENPIHVQIGMNLDQRDEQLRYIFHLYHLINHYHYINFDFYDNHLMNLMNMLVIRDCMAIQCSLDKDHHISMVSIITDINQVNEIYQKIASEFTPNNLLIHSANSEELFYNGYRTEFYAHNNFQIMLTHGFEFLLPPELNPRLIQSARNQGFNENMVHLITHLGITWEEIFEKGCIDFYLLKSRLMQYITDGNIHFTDIIYHMSKDERKNHLKHVLELIQKNPNIRFYIIDDEFVPNSADLFRMSVYNNKKKLFLKNTGQYKSPHHPAFYTVQNNILIQDISQYFEGIQTSPLCNVYEKDDILRFNEKYGTLIERMLSVSE